MFDFKNLDTDTRTAMLEAIKEAEDSGEIYYSSRFNEEGKRQWVNLLKEAARSHNEHWLAYQLEEKRLMKDFELAQNQFGGYSVKHTPHTQAETMAEGQFNRFYMLGLCVTAKSKGIEKLIIYRAKPSKSPRLTSEDLINTIISTNEVEMQLKTNRNSFGSLINKPNSGISLKLP